MRALLGLLGFLAGWYAIPAQDSGDMQLVVSRECITKLELTPKTICHGPDLHHLSCTGFILHYKENCEHWAPASVNDGVLGPFINCKQQYAGENQPTKMARLDPSGEMDTFTNPADPFGIDQE